MRNDQILEEAAAWFVELDGENPTLQQRKAFDQWLRRSPEHVHAFLELLPIWEAGASREWLQSSEVESLIERARQHANVVPLGKPSAGLPAEEALGRAQPKRSGLTRWMKPIAAALLVAAYGTWLYQNRYTYDTDIGEQRSIALSDGSILDLNADSRVRVRMSSGERSIELVRGQALFRVARDAARPFVVRSGQARIRAVGTQFDVYRRSTGTTVTVIEGRVAVSPQSVPVNDLASAGTDAAPVPGGEAALLLSAGQQATVPMATGDGQHPGATAEPRTVDVAVATAWTQRRLMFQKAPLAEVASEFNRYNERKLIVEGAKIREFLISGTFSSADPASLLTFLRTQPGMRVLEAEDEIRIVPVP